jgi:hypothetical protein
MMQSSLVEMLGHYLPSRGTQLQSAFAMPFAEPQLPLSSFPSILDESLTTMELHENSYKIISYGSSINVYSNQTVGAQRLLRYGLPTTRITSLQERGWVNKEPIIMIQDRFVAEMSKRIGTVPEVVDIAFLSRKFKSYIPTADLARDRYRRLAPDLGDAGDGLKDPPDLETDVSLHERSDIRRQPLEIDANSLLGADDTTMDDELFVPSWGEYVRSATEARQLRYPEPTPEFEVTTTANVDSESTGPTNERTLKTKAIQVEADASSSATSEKIPPIPESENTLSDPNTLFASTNIRADMASAEITESLSKPSRSVLEQTIQWSSSSEIIFIPHTTAKAPSRRMVVSPRDVQDHLYLDGSPRPPKTRRDT